MSNHRIPYSTVPWLTFSLPPDAIVLHDERNGACYRFPDRLGVPGTWPQVDAMAERLVAEAMGWPRWRQWIWRLRHRFMRWMFGASYDRQLPCMDGSAGHRGEAEEERSEHGEDS